MEVEVGKLFNRWQAENFQLFSIRVWNLSEIENKNIVVTDLYSI
jgi:hypothetical protein